MGKRVAGYIVLGNLDKKTRLVADSHAFIIQVQNKDKEGNFVWLSKYYYSEIGSAIRGYAKHKARKRDNNTIPKTLMELIMKIDSLEKTIAEIGDRLSAHWNDIMNDPIERAIVKEALHE